ncbi:putative transcriptional regulator [Neorhizobium huautlense]|uniref:Transcriptional regulator n=1 Tax=Neorhizobium huautlense TaxID=67774 RepID=A0ABT9PNX6_9HYPH|nr:ribbon-helix-helix protein, CopG family [Neorhizobium huautlense]MDP9836177.1 putative transcriptional regulator [Neorhizobium huautlense]
MTSHIMSLQISEEMKTRLDELSAATQRPANVLVEDALAAYLDERENERLYLQAAVDRADDGDFVSHAAVEKWLRSWGTPDELPPPEPDILKTRR